MPSLLVRDLEPSGCLSATPFVDCDAPEVQARAAELCHGFESSCDKAVQLFRYVRDEITYEFRARLNRQEYVASRVLEEGKGFCVQKAVLLCALARSIRIPAAIVLCDLRDQSLPERLILAMGTNIMYHHGLTAMFLDGRWLLADASLSPDVVTRKRYRVVAFDGRKDALHSATRIDGSPHAEYLHFHGLYADLPFDEMLRAFMAGYARADLQAMAALGYRLE